MKATTTISVELAELLNEYEQLYKITNEIVDVYKTAHDILDVKDGYDQVILLDYAVKLNAWIELKRRFIKEVRIQLFNQFRAIRDALNPADISNEALRVFNSIRRVSCDIDNNILLLYNTLNL